MFTVGCATRAPIQNVSLSYNTLKNILLKAFPTGLKEQSSNGRTLKFNYFDPNNWSKPAEAAEERAYAVVVINGSSRPYNLEAYMVREKKGANGVYTSTGKDLELSEKLVKEIKALLANRREDRNVIDGFRAF
ncbi:MAG: hypothetical protein V4692_05825 [Bdellovibrionota bacterium]